ncbi:MAG: GAF domain-containing protein, partial [Bacillota bacterium]|nr:GAF domain-containing protein [Bacillota bacterium]
MSEGAAYLAIDGTILFCNAQLASMLRIPLEKLLGTRLSSYIASEKQPNFSALLDSRDRPIEKAEVRLVGEDGHSVDVILSLRANDSPAGRGISAVLTDISSRKRFEEKITRLNRFYSLLRHTSKVIINCADHESLFNGICRVFVEQGDFLLAWIGLVDEDAGIVTPKAWEGYNDGFLDNIRISIFEEPEGLGPTGRTVRSGRACVANDLSAGSEGTAQCEHALRHGHRPKAAVAIRCKNKIIGALTLYSGNEELFDSEFLELLEAIGDDISFALEQIDRETQQAKTRAALHVQTMERLKISEELEQKEQLLIINSRRSAVGETIEFIAHQWRQPLSALSIYAQQLEREAQKKTVTSDYVETITGKVIGIIQSMHQTIEDFRNFSKQEKEKRVFNLAETVEYTLALINDSFTGNNIRIETEVRDDPTVLGFRNEYSQVVLNVINNARDTLIDRKIPSPWIKIRIFREEAKSVVLISDNAGGIPDEIMDRIFDPFVTTKDASMGMGIGLYISRT